MGPTGLPARVVYAALALPIGAAAGFYPTMHLLMALAPVLPEGELGPDGYGVFKMALGVGATLGFTAALIALTLPRTRLKKRGGRVVRTLISIVFLALVTVVLMDQETARVYNLALIAWLAVTVTFTYIRYGVLDRARPRSTRVPAS